MATIPDKAEGAVLMGQQMVDTRYLAKVCGQEVDLPERPRNRAEEYWNYIVGGN